MTGRIQALARKARPQLTCRWLNRRFTFQSASIFAFCSFALPKVSFQLFHLCPNIHADASCICNQVLKNCVPVPEWHARIQLLTCQCSCILAYASIQFAHHIQPISVRTFIRPTEPVPALCLLPRVAGHIALQRWLILPARTYFCESRGAGFVLKRKLSALCGGRESYARSAGWLNARLPVESRACSLCGSVGR